MSEITSGTTQTYEATSAIQTTAIKAYRKALAAHDRQATTRTYNAIEKAKALCVALGVKL